MLQTTPPPARDPALALIYDGIDEDTPWQSLVDHLMEVTDSRDASLHVFSPHNQSRYYLVTSDRRSHLTREYIDGAVACSSELFVERDLEPHCIEELMPRGQFCASQLYQQYLAPVDIQYILTHEVFRSPELYVRLVLERTAAQGQFSYLEKALCNQIAPDLVRAIRLRLRVQEGENNTRLLGETLSQLGIGLFHLNAQSEILQANTKATELLSTYHHLGVTNNRLCLQGSRDQRLKQAIQEVLVEGVSGAASTGIRIETPDDTADLEIVVRPVPGNLIDGGTTSAAAQVFVNELGGRASYLDAQRFINVFGFTRCEANLAVLMADGRSLAEAADLLNVSINTVKSHVRGIYDKLGVRKQARVVSILNGTLTALM